MRFPSFSHLPLPNPYSRHDRTICNRCSSNDYARPSISCIFSIHWADNDLAVLIDFSSPGIFAVAGTAEAALGLDTLGRIQGGEHVTSLDASCIAVDRTVECGLGIGSIVSNRPRPSALVWRSTRNSDLLATLSGSDSAGTELSSASNITHPLARSANAVARADNALAYATRRDARTARRDAIATWCDAATARRDAFTIRHDSATARFAVFDASNVGSSTAAIYYTDDFRSGGWRYLCRSGSLGDRRRRHHRLRRTKLKHSRRRHRRPTRDASQRL